MNYIVGNSHALWPAKPGSMGRPYPGHRIAVIDDDRRRRCPPARPGEVAVNRVAPDGTPDPVFFLEYFGNPEGTRSKFTGDWCRTGDVATRRRRRLPLVPGPRRRHVQGGGLPDRPVRDRELPRQAPGRRERRRGALARRDARQRRQGVHRARAGTCAVARRSRRRSGSTCASILAPYEYPKEIEFIDALPMTTTGKVQRKVLRERERARKAKAR